jgi:DNA-binding NarL/FixJ family response regulator
MLATCWAVKQVNAEANRLYLKNVKARDFEPCKPFELEGRPWIDQTEAFKMVAPPGTAVLPAPSQNGKVQKWELARALRRDGKTLAEIALKLNVAERTVERWSTEGKLDWKKPPSSADDGTGITDEELPFGEAAS